MPCCPPSAGPGSPRRAIVRLARRDDARDGGVLRYLSGYPSWRARALEGDPVAALAGYRAAMATYRDLGLTWDEAQLGLEAALVLGTDDAGIAAWAERSRVVVAGLGARPMLALLDRATAGVAAAEMTAG